MYIIKRDGTVVLFDKNKIIIDIPISSLGYHFIKVELHKNIFAELKIELIKE